MGRAGPEGRSRGSRTRRCRGPGRRRRRARPERRARNRPHLDRGSRRAPVQDVRRCHRARRRQRQCDRPDPAHVRDRRLAATSAAARWHAPRDQRDRLRPGRRRHGWVHRDREQRLASVSPDGIAVVLVNGGDGGRKRPKGTLGVAWVPSSSSTWTARTVLPTESRSSIRATARCWTRSATRARSWRPRSAGVYDLVEERCCHGRRRLEHVDGSLAGSRTAGTRTTPRLTGRSRRRRRRGQRT